VADIRYDIVPSMGGWKIVCNGVAGRPYLNLEAALGDASWIADQLGKAGQSARVYLDGEPVDIDAGITGGEGPRPPRDVE
jgi:hypothetical protein